MGKKMPKLRKFLTITIPILTLFILFSSFPTSHAEADIGPKPSMDFEFEYENQEPLEILDGILFECDLPDCSDARPLEELGPQGFYCTVDSCSSLAYGYRDYHRLLIRFSDSKERQSNVFQSDSFDSTFRVLVRDNDLVVEKIRGSSNPFGRTLIGLLLGSIITLILGFILIILLVITILRAGEGKADFNSSRWIFISLWLVMGLLLIIATFFSFAIPITVAAEMILGLFYAIFRNRSKVSTLTMVFLANTITLLPFWAVTSFLGGEVNILGILLMEILIWLVESAVIYLTQRRSIRILEAGLLSLILNVCSLLIGLILPF